MQEKNETAPVMRRSNLQRSEDMRARLMEAARAVFVEKGFADAGTPEIVKRAEVTRGALYHHFADKSDLFAHVVQAETDALAEDINARTVDTSDAGQALRVGTEAYFASMTVPGRCQLLLVDGPSVLGPSRLSEMHAKGGRSTLVEGIRNARDDLPAEDINALAVALSAAYDRAAFAINEGEGAAPYVRALTTLVMSAMKR